MPGLSELTTHIARLAGGDFSRSSEQDTRERAVNPVIGALGWNVFDPNEVDREYSVRGGRVDYCLRAQERNFVLVEVKRAGTDLTEHQEQLLRYAFDEGASLAVLTDGLVWWLYLPMEKVSWEQRCFVRVSFREQQSADAAAALYRFLNRNGVASGEAHKEAKREFESQERDRRVRAALQDAWERVLGDPESLLREELSDTVKEISGYPPDRETIARFLQDKLASIGKEGGPSAVQAAQMAAGKRAQTPAKPSVGPGSDEAQPRRQARSRVDATIDAMRRPEGVTVTELVALFEAEFGNGKRSTAKQAIYKAPVRRGLKHENTGEKRDGKAVYRIAH